MSPENVEVVRAYVEAYNAGADEFADFLVDFMAEDVEIIPDASRFPDAEPFRGREEYRRYIADIDQDWEGGGRAEIKGIFPRAVQGAQLPAVHIRDEPAAKECNVERAGHGPFASSPETAHGRQLSFAATSAKLTHPPGEHTL